MADLHCSQIEELNINRSISCNKKNVLTTKSLCDREGQTTVVTFEVQELALDRKHFLNISIADNKNQNIKLNPIVKIYPFGITAHHTFIDLELFEIVGSIALVLVSIPVLFEIYTLFCTGYFLKSIFV